MSIWDKVKAMMMQEAQVSGQMTQVQGGGLETPPYAMAMHGTDEAEITLYGNIVSKRPVNYWTGQPEEGNFIILSEFLRDLETLKTVRNLTIHIHSIGGNAYDAITIHNRLVQLSAHKTVIVDGVAMSGGSLIMCAGDTVKVHKSSLIMEHRASALLWDYYNCTQLQEEAERLAKVDKVQAAVYQQKTGRTEEEILALMDKTTYMTGEEAVELGFADELIEGDAPEIAASEDRKTLYVGGAPVFFAGELHGIPESLHIPTVSTATKQAAEINTQNTLAVASNDEGGKQMSQTVVKTAEDLRKEHPDLVREIEAAAKGETPETAPKDALVQAAEAERARIRAIDEIAPMVMDAQMVQDAKYGDSPMTAEALAMAAMKKSAKQGKEHLQARTQEVAASGAGAVTPTAPRQDTEPQQGDDTPAAMEAQASADVELYKKMTGGK